MFKKLHRYGTLHPIAAIVLYCMAIRLLLLVFYSHVTIFPDSEGYIELAHLLNPLNLTGYNGIRTPGYPLLITLAGNYLPLVIAYQMLLGILTTVYTYKTLRLLAFSNSISFYTALLLNSMLHVLFYETNILTEALTLLFMVAAFYHTLKLLYHNNSFKQAVIVSLLLGWLTFIKPFYIFLPFLVYGLYTLKDFSFKNIINSKLVVLLFSLAAFLGWSRLNQVNTGRFTSTTFYGINIAQNCVYFAEKVPPKYKLIGDIYAKHREIAIKEGKDVSMTIWYAYPEMQQKTGLNFTELSDELSRYGSVAIKQNPGAYLKQVLVSFSDFWLVTIQWSYDDFNFKYANKAFLLVFFIERAMLFLLKVLFVLLVPVHLFRYFKNRTITPALIIVVVVMAASVLQAFVTFGTNSRYSYPFEFLMVICLMLTFKHKFETLRLPFFNKK
ncbi:MAG: glycosyltransferase family 39 protein [Bacteroidota bacterium]